MARIETDPNYSGPTFSRATAATDLFKKEDVQNLAAAVSTHDHSSGKGLAVPIGTGQITSAMIADGTIVAGDIADGAITSAKILDGTIATADIALAAVSHNRGGYIASPTFSAAATGGYIATPISVTFLSEGGLLRIEWSAVFQHSVANGQIQVQAGITGGTSYPLGLVNCSGVANAAITVSGVFYASPVAGPSYTALLSVYNASGSGTITCSPGLYSTLWVTEQKR